MPASSCGRTTAAPSHRAVIADQFTRQAEQFAASPTHHNQAALDLLVDAAGPRPGDVSLDVACGPGSVVCAFARRVRQAVGLDATEAMLAEARRLAAERGLDNVAWHLGDVYALPFADGAFDIVSCRFAFHHLEEPAKAAAFNRMERHRDPSTVEFRPLGFLQGLFRDAVLPEPQLSFFQVPAERERLVAVAFPANDDRALLRAMIDASVDGDTMGVNARRDGDTVRFDYPAVVLVAVKGGQTLRV